MISTVCNIRTIYTVYIILVDDFLYSHHVATRKCFDIVNRNKMLITLVRNNEKCKTPEQLMF